MTARAANRGFTLLEMLTATAMVAVLAASLYTSLRVAFRARKTALAAGEATRKMTVVMAMIKADLLSAMIPNGILAGEFTGNSGKSLGREGSDDLTFYAAATDVEPRAGVGDVKKIEYVCELQIDGGTSVLLRRVTTNLLAPTTPEPAEEILCRGVQAFTLRYFDGTTWEETWDSTSRNNALPLAVEVTVTLDDDPDRPLTQVLTLPCGQEYDESASSGGES